MMKKCCEGASKHWDHDIHFLRFASREIPTESLGFSPNELIFGHSVCGPLQFLKEAWVGQKGESNLMQYDSNKKKKKPG